MQFDGSGASNISHRYLWTNEVDELIADEQIGGDTIYGLGDHLGTIRDIANFNEGTSVTSVTNHRKYDSFGKNVSESNSTVDLIFGFTGKQLDEATGLQHNLHRWYDSDLGQWLSEDPIGFNAGDENVKRYVGNAINFAVDPDGLKRYLIGGSANYQPEHHSKIAVDDGDRILIFEMGGYKPGVYWTLGGIVSYVSFANPIVHGWQAVTVTAAPSIQSLNLDYLELDSTSEEDDALFNALMEATESTWMYNSISLGWSNNCHTWAQQWTNVGLETPVPLSEWEYHGMHPVLHLITEYQNAYAVHAASGFIPTSPSHPMWDPPPLSPLDPKHPVWTNPPSGPRLPEEWTNPVDRVESQGIERIDATSCIR